MIEVLSTTSVMITLVIVCLLTALPFPALLPCSRTISIICTPLSPAGTILMFSHYSTVPAPLSMLCVLYPSTFSFTCRLITTSSGCVKSQNS